MTIPSGTHPSGSPPFSTAPWRVHGERAALRLGPGPDDAVLSYRELADAISRRVDDLRRSVLPTGGVVAIETASPALQLIDVLAGLELAGAHPMDGGHPGIEVLVANSAWWPRERDAVFERVRPTWRVRSTEAGTSLTIAAEPPPPYRPVPDRTETYPKMPYHSVSDGVTAGATEVTTIWLASVGSFGEPTAYGFGPSQLATWPIDDDDGRPVPGRVVVTGEVGHAPTLRAALTALAAGAELQLTNRAQLAAVLAQRPIDRLVTTPLLLRRALRQLHRRERRAQTVAHSTLHQGDVRSHELAGWPERLGGTITVSISATEAGGWLLHDGIAVPGIDIEVGEAGAVHLGGRGAAHRNATRPRPTAGWASGDVARHEDGSWRWLGRRRDRFVVDGHEVDPVVVEAVLGAHPLVADVVVAPRPHRRGNVVVAVIVPSNPAWPPFLDDLAERFAELAAWAHPEALAIVDDVPMNAAGAVHRRLVNFEEAGR